MSTKLPNFQSNFGRLLHPLSSPQSSVLAPPASHSPPHPCSWLQVLWPSDSEAGAQLVVLRHAVWVWVASTSTRFTRSSLGCHPSGHPSSALCLPGSPRCRASGQLSSLAPPLPWSPGQTLLGNLVSQRLRSSRDTDAHPCGLGTRPLQVICCQKGCILSGLSTWSRSAPNCPHLCQGLGYESSPQAQGTELR